MLHRHRLLAAGVGIALMLGVAALNAHAALPEHHHHHGEETICAASLSIAVAAGALAVAGRDPGRTSTRLPALLSSWVKEPGEPHLSRPPCARPRAGPFPTMQVLRR